MARWPTLEQKYATFRLVGYSPNPTQIKIHRAESQILQIVGAEGAGKSFVTGGELTACVPWCKLIYLVGQTYDNAQMEFNYLVENLGKLGALDTEQVSQPRHGAWAMTTKTGCRIMTLSVERGASSIIAKGEQPDIIALCEAGVISSYGVFLSSVRRCRRARGRVVLVGTLKDDFGWYAALVDELQAQGNAWKGETYNLPTWTNTALYPGGRTDPEILYLEQTMPADVFARTVAAVKMPGQAEVFGREFSYLHHVNTVAFRPELPVTIWIDPGYFPGAYVVLAVQFDGPIVRHFDEIYVHHLTHQQVIGLALRKEWWANVERAVIDFAGRQHHAEQSAEEIWQSAAGLRPHSQQIGILDGIARHRDILHNRRIIHDVGCKYTLAEYKRYRLRTDRDGHPVSEMPLDKDNHAMKAIAYGLVDKFGFLDNRRLLSVVTPGTDLVEVIDDAKW